MQNYILILNRASILPKKIVCDLIFFFLLWFSCFSSHARVYIDMMLVLGVLVDGALVLTRAYI